MRIYLKELRIKRRTGFAAFCVAFFAMIFSADPAGLTSRHIDLDVAQAAKPLDRFFDLSVGSDYQGTLIRDDSQAQLKLKTAVDELGFRYIRFQAIFHDVLGTVRVENGKDVYDWTKIDQLYDDLLFRAVASNSR
jgi:xylan 1,4-beta-xylosidase